MPSYLQQLAHEQLHALDNHIRLVIVHPNFDDQHTIMTYFLDQDAVYVRFEGKKLSVDDFRDQLNEALTIQTGNTSLSQVKTLILDETDRGKGKAFDRLLGKLLDEINDGRIVVFSRGMPESVLKKDALRKQSAFIPGDESFMLWDYTKRDSEQDLLEVRAFGEGHVLLNGKQVKNWDGLLPRALFFYIVDRGMTTRNEIFETFWPNLSVREATNVFHVTKRKISEVIGIDLTTYWSGFYRISPNINLSYDIMMFNELLQQSAIIEAEEASALLARADAIYRGNFLTSLDMPWVHNRRDELVQNYSESLAILAKTKEDAGYKKEALGLYLRAASRTHNREDLVSKIMHLYRELGMYDDALVVYERLYSSLQDDLRVQPAPHIQALATTIRHEMQEY